MEFSFSFLIPGVLFRQPITLHVKHVMKFHVTFFLARSVVLKGDVGYFHTVTSEFTFPYSHGNTSA
jgi:hypothetical protein